MIEKGNNTQIELEGKVKSYLREIENLNNKIEELMK